MKKFSYEDIDIIIDDIRKAIFHVQHFNNGNVETIAIYMPDYFRTILNYYFEGKLMKPFKPVEFGKNNSFFGITNFYPSPFDQIIVSDLKAPQFPQLTKIVLL